MKLKRFGNFKPLVMAALGVMLGRGAQADTILTFDGLPGGQANNQPILAGFGSNASVSSTGVSVVGGGTPDISLTWRATSAIGDSTTRWDYYAAGVWSPGATQLNESRPGDYHELVFTPSGTAAVKINSFAFFGYYNSTERFTYNWSVLDGAAGSKILTNGIYTFLSDATKNHTNNINFTGYQGETLVLRLTRVASTLTGGDSEGDKGDIAVDDISFSEVVGSPAPPLSANHAYQNYVLGDGPLAYYRLTSLPLTPDVATNGGSLGAVGNGVYSLGTAHPVPGALVASSDTAASFGTTSSGDGEPLLIPNNAKLNSPAFTVEAWVNPALQGLANAGSPLMNRVSDDGASGRQGWVFFQRAAIGQTPPDTNGSGFNFRMYQPGTTASLVNITGGSYSVGTWNHLAATYDGANVNLYVNGSSVASAPATGYAPNTLQSLAIGAWAEKQNGLYENPYTGAIDEVALYTNALTAGQILAHYQNGINSSPGTPYNSVIAADGAVEYLRLNEPAHYIATNTGSLGAAANGIYLNTVDSVGGPAPLNFAGFESTNGAATFNGLGSSINMGDPVGLRITGSISLEAWIKLASLQKYTLADIVTRGDSPSDDGEVVLRLTDANDGNGHRYEIGAWDGGSSYNVTFPIPAQDVGGDWVHLVGTYDGNGWNLYHNGTNAAFSANGTGAVFVNNASWAIGGRGWSGAPDRLFTGGIDEVAIYDHALTPNQVLSHYLAGVNGDLLTITPSGDNVILTWSIGTLQQADFASGPYTDVGAAASPFPVSLGSAKKFYRLKL